MSAPPAGLLLISTNTHHEASDELSNDNVRTSALFVKSSTFGGPKLTFLPAAAAVRIHAPVWVSGCG
jgi:hypothetical protein